MLYYTFSLLNENGETCKTQVAELYSVEYALMKMRDGVTENELSNYSVAVTCPDSHVVQMGPEVPTVDKALVIIADHYCFGNFLYVEFVDQFNMTQRLCCRNTGSTGYFAVNDVCKKYAGPLHDIDVFTLKCGMATLYTLDRDTKGKRAVQRRQAELAEVLQTFVKDDLSPDAIRSVAPYIAMRWFQLICISKGAKVTDILTHTYLHFLNSAAMAAGDLTTKLLGTGDNLEGYDKLISRAFCSEETEELLKKTIDADSDCYELMRTFICKVRSTFE